LALIETMSKQKADQDPEIRVYVKDLFETITKTEKGCEILYSFIDNTNNADGLSLKRHGENECVLTCGVHGTGKGEQKQ